MCDMPEDGGGPPLPADPAPEPPPLPTGLPPPSMQTSNSISQWLHFATDVGGPSCSQTTDRPCGEPGQSEEVAENSAKHLPPHTFPNVQPADALLDTLCLESSLTCLSPSAYMEDTETLDTTGFATDLKQSSPGIPTAVPEMKVSSISPQASGDSMVGIAEPSQGPSPLSPPASGDPLVGIAEPSQGPSPLSPPASGDPLVGIAEPSQGPSPLSPPASGDPLVGIAEPSQGPCDSSEDVNPLADIVNCSFDSIIGDLEEKEFGMLDDYSSAGVEYDSLFPGAVECKISVASEARESLAHNNVEQVAPSAAHTSTGSGQPTEDADEISEDLKSSSRSPNTGDNASNSMHQQLFGANREEEMQPVVSRRLEKCKREQECVRAASKQDGEMPRKRAAEDQPTATGDSSEIISTKRAKAGPCPMAVMAADTQQGQESSAHSNGTQKMLLTSKQVAKMDRRLPTVSDVDPVAGIEASLSADARSKGSVTPSTSDVDQSPREWRSPDKGDSGGALSAPILLPILPSSEEAGTEMKGSPTACEHSASSNSVDDQTQTLQDAVAEEAKQLQKQSQEFEIIDELGSDDEGDSESEYGLDDDEIDAMLDEGMTSYSSQPLPDGEDNGFTAPLEMEKVVMKERGHDPFDILPEGWVQVTHNSGMPVYLHKTLRVCTLSRPYFLGSGGARNHDMPLSAIPCLLYRRELEKERSGVNTGDAASETESSSDPVGPIVSTNMETKRAAVKVESVENYKKEKTIDYLELREYCKKLFEFNTITIKKYKTWKDRRKHHKQLKNTGRPTLPSSTKLITCPVLVNDEDKPNKKKEFVLNPAGKSETCILHEYVQHTLRVHPKYVFKEVENAMTPYSATVIINGVEYSTGYAISKKAAKNAAAKLALGVLAPELKQITDEKGKDPHHDLSYFDEVKIEDFRITDLSLKTGLSSPFQILCECLRRNFGMGNTNFHMEMRSVKHQKSEFTMKVGKHSATVICKNKREGKQRAAQAILQRLHPHIYSWGSLLRLYDTEDVNSAHNKKPDDEVSITALHPKQRQNQPNFAVLQRLRTEMKRFQEKRATMKAQVKGKLELDHVPSMTSVTGVDL